MTFMFSHAFLSGLKIRGVVVQRIHKLQAIRTEFNIMGHLSMQETWVRFLGQEDPLEKETHSSILAWRISWTEEPGRTPARGVSRVGHDLATKSPPSCTDFSY